MRNSAEDKKGDRKGLDELLQLDFSDLEKPSLESVHGSAEIASFSANQGSVSDLQGQVRDKFANLADSYDVGDYESLDTKTKTRFYADAVRVIKGFFDKIYYIYEEENKAFGNKHNQEELFEATYARIRSYVSTMDAAELAKESGLLDAGDNAKFYAGRRLALLKDFILTKDYAFFRLRFRQFLSDKE